MMAERGAGQRPLVSAIVVNYNGLRFLEKCIESLNAAFSRYRLEIVIVDNASSDGSRDWLSARGDIVYVASDKNLGFTGGNNLGAARAGGDRLLFINNDTVVQTPLDAFIDVLDDPTVGVAGCRLLYGDGRQQFSFGYDHTPLRLVLSWLGVEKRPGLPNVFRRLETDAGQYLLPHRTLDWVSGACFGMRRDVWDQLRGFDTSFFMYCEDVDLCSRARALGYRVAYRPDTVVTHFEGAGRIWIGAAALARTADSYLVYLRKHHGAGRARLVALSLGLVFLARSAAFGIRSLFPATNKVLRRQQCRGYRQVGFGLMSSLVKPAASSLALR